MRIIIMLLVVVLIAPASQAATRGRLRRADAASTVTLKGVLKAPPTVVRMAPIVKGRQPEATPTPAPTPEQETTELRPAKPQTRPEPAPAETAPAQPQTVSKPRGPIDQTLANLIAQPANAATRDKLRAYAAGHAKAEQVAPALMRIGQISTALGDLADARKSYESVIRLTSQPAEKALAREGLLEALIHQNDLDQAEAVYKSLRAESPDHVLSPATQVDAGMMLAMQGRAVDARAAWDQLERTLQAMPKPQADAMRPRLTLARGLADELEGRVDQARAAYQEIVSRQPQSEAAATARLRIADISKPLTLTAPATTAKP
ncbi:tetratricopeptide repeat protein [bacterium]|nr:tetratricopeptide repeat protein [bacterium]